MLAGCTTTHSSRPRVSTTRWRLLPLTLLPASEPVRRLAVDDGGGRLRGAALGLADLAAQDIVDALPQPPAPPAVEVVADRPLGGEVVGQGAPGTAIVQAIEDGVDDFPQVGLARCPG